MSKETKQRLEIEIRKTDDLEEGFAAYLVGSVKDKKPIILLNVFTTFATSIGEGLTTADTKQIIIESIMHEFGHAMEEFFDKEFDEEFIERAILTYREKYEPTKTK